MSKEERRGGSVEALRSSRKVQQVTLHHQLLRYGKHLVGAALFDLRSLKLNSEGWVARLIRERGLASESRAEHRVHVDLVLAGLTCAAGNPAWQASSNPPLAKLRQQTVERAFRELEESIRKAPWEEEKKFDTSNAVRRWLLEHDHFPSHVDGASIKRTFTTRFFRRDRPPRALISNEPDAPVDSPRSPLGAIPHKTSQELRLQALATLTSDMDRVKHAARDDLEDFLKERDRLIALATAESDLPFLNELERLAFRQSSTAGKNLPDWIETIPASQLLCAYVMLVHQVKTNSTKRIVPVVLAGKRICDFARKEGIRANENRAYRLLHPRLLSQRELLACAIIIQIKAGWNFSSVIGLRTTDILTNDDTLVITALKQKTGQTTSPLILQSNDHLERLAIKLLLENLEECKALRWTASNTTKLFFNSTSLRAGTLQPFANWQFVLASFISRRNLPNFSLDQVRTQSLAITQLASGNLEETQRKAGHAFLSTTSHYLDQILLYSLNSAINLEYQRALERSVKYIISGNSEHADNLYASVAKANSIYEETASALLHVVNHFLDGSGSTEVTPTTKVKVNIDASAMRSLAIIRRFYLKHWRGLLAENRAKFEKHQLPNMLLHLGLYAIVARGPYRHILAAIESGSPE